MSKEFADVLKKLRTEKNISQQQLANMLYVDRSTIASWETGRRVPDAVMLARLAICLSVDVHTLLSAAGSESRQASVIIVDDEKIILSGSMATLRQAMPDALLKGFLKPSEALAYARSTRVDLALVDIEMGSVNGLDLCRSLLAIDPTMNVAFLTAHMDYSFSAWETGACGFLVKPLTTQKIQKLLSHLRFPL